MTTSRDMEKGKISFTVSLRESNKEFQRAEVNEKPKIRTGGGFNTAARLLSTISYSTRALGIIVDLSTS